MSLITCALPPITRNGCWWAKASSVGLPDISRKAGVLPWYGQYRRSPLGSVLLFLKHVTITVYGKAVELVLPVSCIMLEISARALENGLVFNLQVE